MIALLIFGLPGLLVVALMFLIRELSRPGSQWGERIGNFLGLDSRNRNAQSTATNVGSATPGASSAKTTASSSSKQFKGSGYRLGDWLFCFCLNFYSIYCDCSKICTGWVNKALSFNRRSIKENPVEALKSRCLWVLDSIWSLICYLLNVLLSLNYYKNLFNR